mmetsp:Transcript_38543/g.114509  ORF Transcript_38543/g.114509 Transcript_38543/m.114509 type:complete len:213 (+) Transcript_38543:241-879(+)
MWLLRKARPGARAEAQAATQRGGVAARSVRLHARWRREQGPCSVGPGARHLLKRGKGQVHGASQDASRACHPDRPLARALRTLRALDPRGCRRECPRASRRRCPPIEGRARCNGGVARTTTDGATMPRCIAKDLVRLRLMQSEEQKLAPGPIQGRGEGGGGEFGGEDSGGDGDGGEGVGEGGGGEGGGEGSDGEGTAETSPALRSSADGSSG